MIDFLLDPLAYDFMSRALIVASIAAIVCAVLSCGLVLIGWSLMGDAVSHAVVPGVAIAYIVGIPFAAGALVFGVLAVGLIGVVRDTSRIKEDAAIGVVFTSLFALGLVLISVTPSQIDLNHILFGNMLGVSDLDLAQVITIGLATLTVLVFKRRDLTLFVFDPAHARAIGLSPRRLSALLLGTLALTVVVGLQAVGVILVVAILIIPGATAYLLTDSFSSMLVLAPVMSVFAAVVGIYIAYYVDASPGGVVVLVHSALFALVYLLAPRYGILGARLASVRRRRTAEN